MDIKKLEELLWKYHAYLLEQTDASLVEGEDYDLLLDSYCGSECDGWDLAFSMVDQLLDEVTAPLSVDKYGKPAEMMKINRWLGFIQGVMWSTQCRTINEMREESRPIFK